VEYLTNLPHRCPPHAGIGRELSVAYGSSEMYRAFRRAT
jgi:hypothetical protein